MNAGLLLEQATDWTGQTYEQRFATAAELLFTHGLIPCAQYHRITHRVREQANHARAQRLRNRPL